MDHFWLMYANLDTQAAMLGLGIIVVLFSFASYLYVVSTEPSVLFLPCSETILRLMEPQLIEYIKGLYLSAVDHRLAEIALSSQHSSLPHGVYVD